MAVVLGIDLGTSSVKAMLLDLETGASAVAAKGYGVDIPHVGYAEQDPQNWWNSLLGALGELREKNMESYGRVAAVGFSGQMHGLVLADQEGRPVRPAVIWLDQRSGKQLSKIEEKISRETMGEILRNRISSGFAFPSLLWVRDCEPESLEKAAFLLSPKDYLRFQMTGEAGAEVVDASSTGIFATARRDWAWELIERFGLPERIFPRVCESSDIAGQLTAACAAETGLPAGIPVIYGTGDQPAQSIGNGVISEGRLISNIGTGAQISAFLREPVYDKKLRTNTFCHAVRGAYTIMGATLCGGMSLNWAKNKLFSMGSYDTVSQEAKKVSAGSQGLLYLPYLSGERTPHMDPEAKGMFFGLTLSHERAHFLRAVMEGVTYSLKDCLEVLKELGVDAPVIIASGGGASSGLWLQIQADILEKQVIACTVGEQACLGSCILAAAGTGLLPSLEAGCRRFVTMNDTVYEPIPANRPVYKEGYEKYRELYRRTKDLMKELDENVVSWYDKRTKGILKGRLGEDGEK